MNETLLKNVLDDLSDAVLALTAQVDALGTELLAMQIVLEEKVQGFAEEFGRAQLAAKTLAAKRNREAVEHVERLIGNLRKRLT